MKRSTAILLVAALFLTGVVVGVVATQGILAWGLRRPGTMADWGRRYVAHELDQRLDLSPAQRREIEAAMAETQRELEDFRARTAPDLRAILARGQERVGAILTPAQRREWEAFRRHRRDRWDHGPAGRFLEPPRLRGPMGPPPADPGSPPPPSN